MKAVHSSEKLVNQTTWHYIPEDGTFHGHRGEKFKSGNFFFTALFLQLPCIQKYEEHHILLFVNSSVMAYM
jgi:hypothetical protein